MVCPPVGGDNPLHVAIAGVLSHVQVDNYGITSPYRLHHSKQLK